MKMKKEHYEKIKKAMEEAIAKYPKEKEFYKEQNFSKERYAWDIYHASVIDGIPSSKYSCKVLYEYLNDSHITTALLRIVGEY